MAIGDPIDFGRRRADTWVKRFDAPNGRDAVERDLLRYPLFEVDFPRSWFWNLWSAMTLRLRRSGRGIGLRPERYGILALADRFNDVFRVGVGSAGWSRIWKGARCATLQKSSTLAPQKDQRSLSAKG